MEFFSTTEYRHLWSPLPEVLLNNLDPSVALADLANLLLDPQLRLPCSVVREQNSKHSVPVNCLESDDLQGFKPLTRSKIGHVSSPDFLAVFSYMNNAFFPNNFIRNSCQDPSCTHSDIFYDVGIVLAKKIQVVIELQFYEIFLILLRSKAFIT